MKSTITMILLFCIIQINAQTSIQGKTIDGYTNEALIGTNLSFYQNDILIWETQTDRNGNYSINLDPGSYHVLFSYVGYTLSSIYNVTVNANQITKLDWSLSTGVGCCDYSIYDYRLPLLQYDQTTQGAIYTSKDLRRF